VLSDYTNCCLYRVDPPDDEQQACSKHVEAYYWSELVENSAYYWFMLYGYSDKVTSKEKPSSLLWTVKVKPTNAYSSLSSRCSQVSIFFWSLQFMMSVRMILESQQRETVFFHSWSHVRSTVAYTRSNQMPAFNVLRNSRKKWIGSVYCSQTVKIASFFAAGSCSAFTCGTHNLLLLILFNKSVSKALVTNLKKREIGTL